MAVGTTIFCRWNFRIATAQQMLDVNRQESMNCCLEKTL